MRSVVFRVITGVASYVYFAILFIIFDFLFNASYDFQLCPYMYAFLWFLLVSFILYEIVLLFCRIKRSHTNK